MKKIMESWKLLDEDMVVNRRLLFFEFLTAVLAGILFGILITPLRSITIASNNDGCCASACCNSEDEDDGDE